MSRTSISNLRYGMTLNSELFLLRDKVLAATRAGDPILHLTLGDRTGSISGVFFDVPGYVADSLRAGKGVEVTGRVSEFKGRLQVHVERIEPAELANLDDFVPGPRRPMDEMLEEFASLRASIQDPDLSRLISSVFDDPDTYGAFIQAPAAKVLHHACRGGLLEHTLAVSRLVLQAAELHPEMDRDLVLAVALLHDLGKIQTYDSTSFALTDAGCLWSHLYISASRVERAIDSLSGFDPEMRLRVVHGLLASHGRPEHGSPVLPMTLEALAVHHADNLDATVRGAIDHFGRMENSEEAFTERSFMHDTRLFRGRPGLPPDRG